MTLGTVATPPVQEVEAVLEAPLQFVAGRTA